MLCGRIDALASRRVSVVLVARISCGVYAGKHRKRIKRDFMQILQQVLQENVCGGGWSDDTCVLVIDDVGAGLTRAHFFKAVLVPMIWNGHQASRGTQSPAEGLKTLKMQMQGRAPVEEAQGAPDNQDTQDNQEAQDTGYWDYVFIVWVDVGEKQCALAKDAIPHLARAHALGMTVVPCTVKLSPMSQSWVTMKGGVYLLELGSEHVLFKCALKLLIPSGKQEYTEGTNAQLAGCVKQGVLDIDEALGCLLHQCKLHNVGGVCYQGNCVSIQRPWACAQCQVSGWTLCTWEHPAENPVWKLAKQHTQHHKCLVLQHHKCLVMPQNHKCLVLHPTQQTPKAAEPRHQQPATATPTMEATAPTPVRASVQSLSPPSLSLSLSLSCSVTLSLSPWLSYLFQFVASFSHSHSLFLSLSLSHTHTHCLSLSHHLSLSLSVAPLSLPVCCCFLSPSVLQIRMTRVRLTP